MSDVLLEEIRDNVENFIKDPKFLTNKLKADDAKDKINSIIVAEQIKLGSLRRQHELVNKMHLELPGRISQVESDIISLEKNRLELESTLQDHQSRVQDIFGKILELKLQFEDVLARLEAKREDQALSIFQREHVWELITKIVDLRKFSTPFLVKSVDSVLGSATKEKNDFEYLSLRIDQNDAMLRTAEEQLNIVGNY